jgi:replicative DNA helicase
VTLIISTEMSAIALGKRSVQFASDVWQSRWVESVDEVERQTDAHFENRADCFVEVDCSRADDAVELIRQYRQQHKVECVVVDYAQNLGGKANGRYEEMTKTSIALRQAATQNDIVLVALVQMGRAIEKRDKFIPVMSDTKESGQFEQDADVIVFSVWPYRLKPENPMDEYQFHVMKNRNREIVSPFVLCKFDPSRQTFTGESKAIPFEPAGSYFQQASQRDADGF